MRNDAVRTTAAAAPITAARPVRAASPVPHAGTPRADVAPSVDTPHPAPVWPGHSVLQAHVAFFSGGKDWITPGDTYRGFHKIGFNAFLSCVAVLILHSSFALWSTADAWWKPTLSISVKNIHAAKHGSDSGSFGKR